MHALLSEITWRPSIGDPGPIGWSITFSYLVAAVFCFLAGRNQQLSRDRRLPWFWFVLSALMFGLGLNKQLDLQVLLVQIGREVARQDGWLQYRRLVQAVFVIIGAGVGIAGLAAAVSVIEGRWKQFGLSFLGTVLLLAFVVIRAAYLSNVSRLMDRIPVASIWINNGLELSGTVLVALGALINVLPSRQSPSKDTIKT